MEKDKKLEITKQKLLNATTKLMFSTDDPMKVTSREIAAAAEVRPSMINYCFGSREKLIHEVFQSEFRDFLEKNNISSIVTGSLPPREILKKLHFLMIGYLLENSQFTRAITGLVLFSRDLNEESFSYPLVMKHFAGRKTETECRMIAYELSAMMQLIIYRKDDIKEAFGLDLEDEEQLKKYLDMRFELLMPD